MRHAKMMKWMVAIGLAMAAAPALAAGPQLATPPPAAAPATPEKRSGVLTLAGGAFAYLPKGLTGAPVPLLVYFVGAGGQARDVLTAYRDHADREGFVLLIPSPKGATWDMVDNLSRRIGIEMNVTPRYGRDLKALDASLADLFGKVAIDPKRIAVIGFSNGATYALSVGTANPQLFSAVLALSPGPAFPTRFDPAQRVFISHGESDEVLPFSYTRGVVAKLRVRKMQVDFMPFKGRHEIPAEARTRALEVFLERPLKG
ncbi:MAG TPA: alpha/beta hydrolase-fold protein [Sphingomicrobium sp.]|nr:alpha/beta hydrolase-fold protein [Sphingomicrobium sp.]